MQAKKIEENLSQFIAFCARACYNKRMKKQISTILLAGAAFFVGAATIGGALSLNVASADEGNTDAFITPSTYEQYLPLDAPNSVAFSNHYTAIADGNQIHVYNPAEEKYYTYTHTANNESEKNRVKKMQFASDNTLYYLDGSAYLYTLRPSDLLSGTPQSDATGFSCSNFLIDAQTLYFTVTTVTDSTLSKVPLSNPSPPLAEEVQSRIVGTPVISMDGRSLYYIDGGKTLQQVGVDSLWRPQSDDTISSMAVLDGVLYYTTEHNKDFCVYDLAQSTLIASYEAEEGKRGYSSVTVFGDSVYVVKDQSVCEYSPQEKAFTQFEIGASSSSTHRLQAGTDSVLFEDELYIADAGAKRVSIYHTVEKTYTTIDDTIEAKYIASDGKTVLLASNDTLALYDKQTKEAIPVTGADILNGTIVGIAQVYGKYYFVTNYHQYGCISFDGAWKAQSVNRESSHYLSLYPHLLTSDVQGNLYTLMSDGSVYRLSESVFFSTESLGEPIYTSVSLATKKLLVDYDQNVYALQENSLLKYTPVSKNNATKIFELGKTLAYTQTTSTPVTSLAFWVEQETAYLLYNGNLVLSTLDLQLPCMANIGTENVDEVIFSEGEAEFTVVKTPVDTLLVEFDLTALSGADVFPYVNYLRTEQELTALQIGQTSDYVLLAIFHQTEHAYRTYLAKTTGTVLPEVEDYRLAYTENEIKTGWLSSAANLYKFPYLTELLTVTQLPKNQKLTLLGEISELDYDYYHVQYVAQDGTLKEGYVPQAFINFFDGTPPQATESVVGDGSADTDASWRALYILLGCAAIIILVDFLILQPKKKEEE